MLSFLRLVGRSRALSATRLCTRSCGLKASKTIPFPGANSIFSSRCGAIYGRVRFAVMPTHAAIAATETPRFKGSTVSSGTGYSCTHVKRLRSSARNFLSGWGVTQLSEIHAFFSKLFQTTLRRLFCDFKRLQVAASGTSMCFRLPS